MKKLKKYMTIYLYIFIIFTSMLPTKENMVNISKLKTIIPGIETLYNNNENNNDNNLNNKKDYSIKILEIIQNIF